jgi:hypothetical protein
MPISSATVKGSAAAHGTAGSKARQKSVRILLKPSARIDISIPIEPFLLFIARYIREAMKEIGR